MYFNKQTNKNHQIYLYPMNTLYDISYQHGVYSNKVLFIKLCTGFDMVPCTVPVGYFVS